MSETPVSGPLAHRSDGLEGERPDLADSFPFPPAGRPLGKSWGDIAATTRPGETRGTGADYSAATTSAETPPGARRSVWGFH